MHHMLDKVMLALLKSLFLVLIPVSGFSVKCHFFTDCKDQFSRLIHLIIFTILITVFHFRVMNIHFLLIW